jgi:hypothetical protein
VRRTIPLLALPLALAACSGNSSSSSTTNEKPRLTQKQFVAAANQVCVNSDRRIYRIGRLSLDPTGWARTAAAARIGVAQMKRITPPAAKDAGFAKLTTQGTRLANGIQKVHDALVKKDYVTARKWQNDATIADTAIHRQAQKLGLTFCQQLLTNWPA